MAASKDYVIIVPLVIAKTESGDRYLYQNAPVPSDLSEDEVARLLEGGFISEVEAAEDVVEIPEGDPTDVWTVKQLKAYAGTLSIDLGEATKKDDILAVLVAAK